MGFGDELWTSGFNFTAVSSGHTCMAEGDGLNLVFKASPHSKLDPLTTQDVLWPIATETCCRFASMVPRLQLGQSHW